MSYVDKRSYSLYVSYKILGIILFGCLSSEGMCLSLLFTCRCVTNPGATATEVWVLGMCRKALELISTIQDRNVRVTSSKVFQNAISYSSDFSRQFVSFLNFFSV